MEQTAALAGPALLANRATLAVLGALAILAEQEAECSGSVMPQTAALADLAGPVMWAIAADPARLVALELLATEYSDRVMAETYTCSWLFHYH